MKISYRFLIAGSVIGTGAAVAVQAAAPTTMDVSVTIPRLNVAEYHRPYVAIYVEKTGTAAKTVAVWYDYDMKNNEGTKWLRDVQKWWRASGRTMRFPASGVSGPTRAPGTHKVSFSRAQLGATGAGQYTLVVEAAREVGGKEVVRVPFTWPAKRGAGGRAAGREELGAVSVSFR